MHSLDITHRFLERMDEQCRAAFQEDYDSGVFLHADNPNKSAWVSHGLYASFMQVSDETARHVGRGG